MLPSFASKAAAADVGQVQYAMFYHPPRDGTSAQTLAERTSALIFTYGDEGYLDQMRDHGFSGPALQYLMANETSGPPPDRTCDEYLFYPNNIAGLSSDFCSALNATESNFLHNARGQRLYSTQAWSDETGRHTVYLYLMNPSAQGWQTYVTSHLPTLLAGSPYTGVFLDNVDLAPSRGLRLEANSDGTVEEYASVAAYQSSVRSYLDAVRAALPGGMQLWANLTEGQATADSWDVYLQYLDGVMDEAFGTGWHNSADEATWLAHVQLMEAVLQQGRSFVAVGQGAQDDSRLQQFALASYLLGAGDNAYFRYASDEHYYEAWWYSDYEGRLGAALGGRYSSGNGAWQRDFTCGSVRVNPMSRTSTITLSRHC